jgi:hypothetical protein
LAKKYFLVNPQFVKIVNSLFAAIMAEQIRENRPKEDAGIEDSEKMAIDLIERETEFLALRIILSALNSVKNNMQWYQSAEIQRLAFTINGILAQARYWEFPVTDERRAAVLDTVAYNSITRAEQQLTAAGAPARAAGAPARAAGAQGGV